MSPCAVSQLRHLLIFAGEVVERGVLSKKDMQQLRHLNATAVDCVDRIFVERDKRNEVSHTEPKVYIEKGKIVWCVLHAFAVDAAHSLQHGRLFISRVSSSFSFTLPRQFFPVLNTTYSERERRRLAHCFRR